MKAFKFLALILALTFTSAANIYGQVCDVTTGYVGNTFSGANDKWVQNYSEELDVASDGTMVTTSTWDEAGRCIGVWKDGLPVTLLQQADPNDGCWGWGTGTEAAAVDDEYLYAVNCANNLLRWNRNGYRYIDKTNVGESTDRTVGMTYSAGYIYLVKISGLVEKRSVSGLSTVSLSFTVTGGYDVAVDNNGKIWVLTTDKQVLEFDPSGVSTGVKITGQPGWSPSAVNYDAYNNLLLVPDNGPRRQVIKFNTSGEQVGTFGDEGGISGGPAPGIVGDLRFWNIAGCGTDNNGNIYVALNEKGTSLRKFDPDGIKQWEVQSMFFVDQTSIDPASDGNDIYGVNEHMKYDYSTNTWSLHSITCDAIANPSDPRVSTDGSVALMRRVAGNLLMFVTSMYAGHFDVYRFDGEIAVFCQSIEGVGYSGLPDKNGNIWYEKGSAIRKIPLTGFSNGVPVFGAEVIVASSIPAPMTGVERLEYDADKDVMYIGGWTVNDPNDLNDWGIMGNALSRYANWSTGNRIASNTVSLPRDASGHAMKAMSVAGDYVFTGLSSESGKLSIFSANDLSFIGNITVPATLGLTGWLDLPHAIQAFKKSNGQYLILVEDDFRGKNVLHIWCPTGDCTANDQRYPDLVASEFEMINANNEVVTELVAGQAVRFRVKVTNKGSVSSPAGINFSNGKSFKVKFNIVNLATNASTLLQADTITQALAPGESINVVSYSKTSPYQWIVPKGKFSITTQVNPLIGANFFECNRANNSTVLITDSYDEPYFVTKLADQIIDFGQSASFSVVVLGDGPMDYKWYVNDVEQINFYSNELLLTNVPIELNGAKIKVVASNPLGSITSNEVTLTVLAVMKLTGGVKFASSGNETEGNAFDGDITTFFDGLSESYMGIDYGTPKKLVKIRFYPRNNWAGRMNGGKFQGSNDGIEYTDIYTINYTPAEKTWKVVVIENEAVYRYLRYQGPVNGYGNVAEIEFWTPYIFSGLTKAEFKKVVLFPNPANDRLFLSQSADKIIISGMDGKEIIISKGSQVDISSLTKGIYLVKYFVDDNVGVSKIVKQ